MSHVNQQIVGGALSLCLGLALWFWLIPNWIEPDPDLRLPVDLVPRIVAIGFFACGLATLANGLVRPRESAPGGFDSGEFQGFLILLAVLTVATIGFQMLHFLVVAPILVAVTMWMFGPIKPVSLVLTSALGPVLIWFVGTEVLGRVLP